MFSLVNALPYTPASNYRVGLADPSLTTELGEPRGLSVFPLTCEECQAVLDVYISDEMDGRDVQREYPLVYQHLQTCADCSALYAEVKQALSEGLDAVAQPAAETLRARLSFLRLPTEMPWLVRPLSRLSGRLEGVMFVLSQAHVQATLRPAGSGVRYEQDLPASLEPNLLLLDTVMLGQERLTVEITATAAAGRADHLVIRGQISSPMGVEPGLRATLRWLGQTQEAAVASDGAVEFGEVLARAEDLASDQAGLQIALTRTG